MSEEKSCAAKITEKPSERAWAGALTLIVLVMLLNLLGRFIAKRFAPKTGR